MSEQRELPIYLHFPEAVISDGVRRDVDGLVFLETPVLPANIDTILTLSEGVNWRRQGIKLREVFERHNVRQLILTGGMPWKKYPKDEPNLGQPQSMALYRLIQDCVPEETMVGIEAKSMNTRENVVLGWDALPTVPEGHIVVVNQNWHTGRGVRTVRAVAQENGWQGEFLVAPYQPLLSEKGAVAEMDPRTWPGHPLTRDRVYGELRRMWTYGHGPDGNRKDLLLAPEDRKVIEGILDLVQAYEDDRANSRIAGVNVGGLPGGPAPSA